MEYLVYGKNILLRRTFVFTLLLSTLYLHSLFGQGTFNSEPKNKKAESLYKEARTYAGLQDYSNALDHIYKCLKISPDYKTARLFLAETYLKGKRMVDELYTLRALDQYSYLYRRDSIFNADVCLKMVKLMIEAPHVYEPGRGKKDLYLNRINSLLSQYLQHGKPDAEDTDFAQYLLEECKNLSRSLIKPNQFNMKNLGSSINSPNSEYFPTFTADDSLLIFTRRFISAEGNLGDEDFYVSYRTGLEWSPAQVIKELQTKQNEGASSMSPDGKILIFAKCDAADSYGNCDLYISYKTGDTWGKPENLGKKVNSAFWDSQPSIAADGRSIYFASTRPGGFGQEDIYVAHKDTHGVWQTPINLGQHVNTSGRDTDPFIHASGSSLYFTSDGWLGLGGFDIFESTLDKDDKWQRPINPGAPINTMSHEKGIVLSADGTQGFFYGLSENGFGYMDIYSFTADKKFMPTPASYVKGTVKSKDNKTILNADIKIIDLNKPSRWTYTKSDSINGSFLVTLAEGSEYAFYVEKDGYILKSYYYDYRKPANYKAQNLKLELEKIEKDRYIVFNNLFFDFDKADLLSKSVIELNQMLRFLKKNPNLKIQIQGHTDATGTATYNQKLSERRAGSVHSWLLKNMIPKEKLSFIGFGKKKPLYPNSSEQMRQYNRRTEFRIVSL